MSTTLKRIAPGVSNNGWSAPTTNRLEGVAKKIMQELIKIITASHLPKALTKVKALGKTLKNTRIASLPTTTSQQGYFVLAGLLVSNT